MDKFLKIGRSTAVKSQQRSAVITALTQSTVQKLDASSTGAATARVLLLGTGDEPGSTSDVHATLCQQARTFAQRGGAPMLKGELVHLIVFLRSLQGTPISTLVYMSLLQRGIDELYALLRALIYAPEFMVAASSATAAHVHTATAASGRVAPEDLDLL